MNVRLEPPSPVAKLFGVDRVAGAPAALITASHHRADRPGSVFS